jgi:cullin 3
VHGPAEGVPQIWDAGLQLFIDRIIGSPIYPIRQHVLNAVLRQLRLERDGYAVNRSTIKGAIEVYRNLTNHDNASVFKKELEPSILRETEAYYRLEGETLISSCSAPEYLRKVRGRTCLVNLYLTTYSG